MASEIKLHINKPCQEDWSKMTPGEKGRHCIQCNKTVTDFSLWSDKQIIAFLKQSHTEICGRLQPHQLDRPLDSETSNGAKSKLKLVLTFLTTFWIGTSTKAQGEITAEQKSLIEREMKPSPLRPADFIKQYKILVAGSVKDKRGNAISGAIISINGTACCMTDSLGNFNLNKAILLKEHSIDVAISALGYTAQYVKRSTGDRSKISIFLDDMEIAPPVEKVDIGVLLQGRMGGISIERRSFVRRWISSVKSAISKI